MVRFCLWRFSFLRGNERHSLELAGEVAIAMDLQDYSFFRLHGSSAGKWDPYQARDWSALAVVGNAGKSCSED
jgi:hypothetical protein